MYSNVLSKDPINIEANFVSPNVSGTITTLAGATYENKTVIIFGTSAGIISQAVLLQNYSILENYKMTVDLGNEIKKIYAIGEETVYVMSSKRVVKYATTNCSEFESCEDVMKGKHPLCGWCVYKERATRRHVCSNNTNHWISSFENCLTMSVAPNAVPLSVASNSSNTRIIIKMKDIPLRELGDAYLCLFSMHSNIYITNAEDLDYSTLSCSLPIISVHGNVRIKLLVKTLTGLETTLSSASIQIYDCRKYKRCMECINTEFVQCNWCGQDASCEEPNSGCPRPISIISECPHLLNNKGNFLPLGTRSVLSFRIANAINSTGVIYRCMLQGSESVMATLKGDFLSCRMQVSQITHRKKKEKLKIVITYGPRIDSFAEIDDLFVNSVTVYRCEQMALDCSHCQALNKLLYSCYWGTNNKCVHNGAYRVSNCSSPNITEITPTTGPIYGGTYVTIYGSNLGTTMLDIETITVANVTCDLMNDTTIESDPDFESLEQSR
ncbi:plexin-B-like [Ruditapes philippinarum]|uniref:plexin-B-like n=1 Tax=Ruditapes philippinarum TaxID=129788 RepID=UPI00295AF53B|nr:plexin-B-like [Ruditapes philippinarum]